MKQALIGAGLSLANLALVGGMIVAAMGTPAHAQGQNRSIVEKTSRAVACPSGWRTPDGDTALCEPIGTLSPKNLSEEGKGNLR